MSNKIVQIDFLDPSKVTGLTSGTGGLIVGSGIGLTELSIGNDDQIMVVDSGQPEGIAWNDRFEYFMGYSNVNTNIVAGFTAIPWNVEQRKDSIYIHSANSPNITVTVAGDYLITASVTTTLISGFLSDSIARLTKDTGGGAMEIVGSRTGMSNITTTTRLGTGTINLIETFDAGDIIAVEAQRVNGTAIVNTLANHCRITIRKL